MKKTILFILVIINVQLLAQDTKAYNTSYMYEMDDYFNSNRNLINHLDTIVPLLFVELKNARAVDNPKKAFYKVIISCDYKIEIEDQYFNLVNNKARNNFNQETYLFNTSYNFNSLICLKDKNDKIIKVYFITDSKNSFIYKYEKDFPVAATIAPNSNSVNYTTNTVQTYNPPSSAFNTPLNFLSKNNVALIPRVLDINRNIEKSILEIVVNPVNH